MVGLIQATEVIKYITGLGQGLAGKLMLIDSLNWDIQTINIEKNKKCPLCGDQPSITELIDYENFCGEAEINLPAEMQLSPGELNALLATDERIRLLDVRETPETIICRIEKGWRVSETELVGYMGTLSKDEPVVL
jgi:adenylyltransferase/sulfurtransferase